jgi:hypothetical protein
LEYINHRTGERDPRGTIVLVRQVEKIEKMEKQFGYLRATYNARNKVRKAALPLNAIKNDCELEGEVGALLDNEGKATYQSLVGNIGWVVNSTRPDCKLGSYLLSTRMGKPRRWDMFLAVWVMDYLVDTKLAPLVLGGPVIDPEIWADASFGTLDDRRSIVAHLATTGRGSGAIYASVGSTKMAVTSVWEAELVAGCAGMDTGLYITHACQELKFSVDDCRNVWVDNQGEIDWVKGNVSNKRSRHIEVRLYRARHLQKSGEVDVKHVSSGENMADILPKPLAVPVFRQLAAMILDHGLLEGLESKVKGLIRS